MKKLLGVMILMSFTLGLFADDAKVLPAGVIRLSLVDIIASSDQEFDSEGKLQDDTESSMNIFGAALEFGITDSLTGAIQWTPGVVLSHDAGDNVILSGLMDVFVGAKYQVINTDAMRFAVALGAKVPLDTGYDGIEEYTNLLGGDDFKPSSMSTTQSVALGMRLYYDYIINESFYVNLYNQSLYYLPNTASQSIGSAELDYEYGIHTEFEIEPNYAIPVMSKSKVELYAPISYKLTPAPTVEGVEPDSDSNASIMYLSPGVSFFFAESFMPMQLNVEYALPVMGKNSTATKNLVIILKLFAAL